MTNSRRFWGGALALNLAWALTLPTTSGKVVALIGLCVAAVALASSPRTGSPGRIATLAVFAMPAMSLVHIPRLAFWRVDGRALLIVAWMILAITLDFTSARDRPTSDAPIGSAVPRAQTIFLFWSCLFWLTLVFDLGVSRFIVNVNRTVGSNCRIDPLTTMISVWERVPVSEHLFLAWRHPNYFAERMVYDNHVHPYLLSMYGWIAAVRAVARVPLYAASNSTTILAMIVVLASFATVLVRTGVLGRCRGAAGFLVLFVATGFIVTTWRFWDDLDRFNTDNPYPILAALFVAIYTLLIAPRRPRLAILTSLMFVALSPIHLPMLLLAVACLFMRPGGSARELIANNRFVLRLCAWATAVAAAVMATPWLLTAWKGYHGLRSSYLFRSGLDGDTTYFHSIVQAAWSGCPLNCCGTPRTFLTVVFPAFLPLAVFLPIAARTYESDRFGGFSRLLMFLATPYLVSLIFFPQAVSIHPYLYDHLLIVPAVIVGGAAMTTDTVRANLKGTRLLAFLMFTAALIMSNLIAVAQGLAHPL